MSTGHVVSCACGYKTEIVVGGLRSNFRERSLFPHLCTTCGLVSVNIQVKPHACPKCNGKEVKRYGLSPLSIVDNKDEIPAIQCWKYRVYGKKNLCPSCGKHDLVFSSPTAFFD